MSKKNILKSLENLDEKELKVLLDVLGKLKGGDEDEAEEKVEVRDKPQKGKRLQRRHPKSEQPQSNKKAVESEPLEDLPLTKPTQRAKVQRQVIDLTGESSNGRPGGSKKKQAIAQAIDVSKPRPNKFLKSTDFNAAKADTLLDRLLKGNNVPTERKSAVTYVRINCDKCGRTCEVHPDLIYSDEEKHYYTCDNCHRRGP